ncbi:MAG: chromate transporter, partial [Candidatus Omnitrophota bacterium]
MILLRLFVVFLKVGLFTIGSGYSMLVLSQRYVVDTYHWMT